MSSSRGKIVIPNVTGDISITINAVRKPQENAFPSKFFETDGVTVYNGTGYKTGYRFNSALSEVTITEQSSTVTGYLSIAAFQKVKVTGATAASYSGGFRVVYYDASHTAISGAREGASTLPNGEFSRSATGDDLIPANAAYMRLCVNVSNCTGTPPALTVYCE